MALARRRRALTCAAVVALGAIQPATCAAQSQLTGEQIFSAKCARCHGAAGEGTDDQPQQLVGDLSVTRLAAVISETMPEDDPGTLSADESQAVAAYIHEAFYSPIARARNQPARIELARLTVRQYRHVVADLIGSFGPRPVWGDERGLTGEYYASREPQGRESARVVRTDAGVDFDFWTEAPVAEIEEPRTYSIRWSGALLAPDTGDFQFVVRTNHAARLWINGMRTPLIDAWVKSGDDTEYAASQYLVGGRLYGVRLEFTKAKQGVDDSEKQTEKPPSAPASVALLWRRPQGTIEVIPARALTTQNAQEAFICTTPFPPDDRSYGWERGTALSQAWDESTTNGAVEAAQYVVDHVDELAQTNKAAEDRLEKLRAFCRTFAERGFRRPLDEAAQRTYIDEQFAATEDADVAVRRVVLLVLKSPRFLFRELGDDGDEVARSFDAASRMALGLWNSLPDDELRNAARDGRLETADGVRAQAERMLGDYRAQAKLQEFLLTWLHLDAGADLTKDSAAFPEFDAEAIADARSSLELMFDEVLSSPNADYRRLLLGSELPLNLRLARLYTPQDLNAGTFPEFHTEAIADAWSSLALMLDRALSSANADYRRLLPGSDLPVIARIGRLFTPMAPQDHGFHKVRLDDGQRAGVLTHPYVMARFAYSAESSPIHRGVFLARGILGRTLRPPPNAFSPLPPELHPDLTTRERVTLQTQASECMSCHEIINPLGFALERFDAIGRYREIDRGKTVDASATYQTPAGETVRLNGARELAEYLAASEDSHAAFVEQLFHHLVQQPAAAYGDETVARLVQSFSEHEFNIRHLAAEIMVATALVGRDTETAAAQVAN